MVTRIDLWLGKFLHFFPGVQTVKAISRNIVIATYFCKKRFALELKLAHQFKSCSDWFMANYEYDFLSHL